MSEPLGATRVKAPAKLARLWAPHPRPLVPQRSARDGEIPSAALKLGRVAVGAGWAVSAFYALGWRASTAGVPTGELRASVLLRMKRGDERAVALWGTLWPIPDGVAVPDLPPLDLPRDGHVNVLRVLLAGQDVPRAAPPDVTVKWSYELGAYWTRQSPPLGGEGRSGWWSAMELRTALLASA